ncbi:hypothetical protein [Bifidobacterium sp. ESL0790]|nr:hypothetical protein [Bifidobacterium sp. ESL0790]WEV73078.1 hypothetical protein OZY47_03800 [Bifidobacterium sp. ESL0790]
MVKLAETGNFAMVKLAETQNFAMVKLAGGCDVPFYYAESEGMEE